MKTFLCCVFLCLCVACEPDSQAPLLQEGEWTGGLTPMNHPEMVTPIAYLVDYEAEDLTVVITGPWDTELETRDPKLQGDTLRFSFIEPEGGFLLQCAFGRDPDDGFAGRCADGGGKWAHFTMLPPVE